jgi:hypothetical protein
MRTSIGVNAGVLRRAKRLADSENRKRKPVAKLTAAVVVFGTAAACRGTEPPPAAPGDQMAPPATTSVAELPTADTASPSTPNASDTSGAPMPSKDLQTSSAGAAVACGRMPGQKIEKVPWRFGSGNAECDRLETLWANVPQPDLACNSDADCTVVSTDGNCINLPLSKKAAAKKEYQKAPCGNPASGACATQHVAARCEAGCCGVSS